MKDRNYINIVKGLWKWYCSSILEPNDYCLMMRLIAISNDDMGWGDCFMRNNYELCGYLKLSYKQLTTSRNRLSQLNLISFDQRNGLANAKYKINYDVILFIESDTFAQPLPSLGKNSEDKAKPTVKASQPLPDLVKKSKGEGKYRERLGKGDGIDKLNKTKLEETKLISEGDSENNSISILTEEPKFSINDAIAFTLKPYVAQNDIFKKMHTEKEYTDYQWFTKVLVDNSDIFANFFTSQYQVTLPQYKKLIYKFSTEEIVDGLKLLCGKPVLKEHRMCHRIVEYIGYVIERANRSNLSQKNANKATSKQTANTANYTSNLTDISKYYDKPRESKNPIEL